MASVEAEGRVWDKENEEWVMRRQVAFICTFKLGEKKAAEYEAEAQAAGVSLDDYLKDLVEDNLGLVLGDDWRY